MCTSEFADVDLGMKFFSRSIKILILISMKTLQLCIVARDGLETEIDLV